MAEIASQLPPLAPFPPPSIRESLSAGDWEACLDAWTLNLNYRLKLDGKSFKTTIPTALDFLTSFLEAHSSPEAISSPKEQTLRQLCFNFSRKILRTAGNDLAFASSLPGGLFSFLASFCMAYQTSSALKKALDEAWKDSSSVITSATENEKIRQIKLLSINNNSNSSEILSALRRTSKVVQSLPYVGSIFMTGDDYLEALSTSYSQSLESNLGNEQKALTEVLFVCLRALTQVEPPQASLLLDQLFSLKTSCIDAPSKAKRNVQSTPIRTILSSLICSTSFLQHLRTFFADPNITHHIRAQSTLTSLQAYQQQMSHMHPPPRRRPRKISKGKGRIDGGSEDHEMHIHSMSQVSTLQELFPDLPPAYFLKLLDHFNDDVESVTAALLEPSSLPAHLADPNADTVPEAEPIPKPKAPVAFVPERKNVFDDDDFANLRISSNQVHFGKATAQDAKAALDEPVSERSKHKAAILSALAAFDSDEDERDDTYDVADVGGTVDSAIPGTADIEALQTKKEESSDAGRADEILYRLWKDDQTMFARDSKTRVAPVRSQLKRDLNQATGQTWTDEMIEGWAVMLTRDTGRQRKLEKRFGNAVFTGAQVQLDKTSWQASTDEGDESGEASDGPGRGGHRGRGGRGRGRGQGRGRGGSTAGPSGDASTQAARRRKEQRGGGNHSRREGRAKKISRGFGGQPA